MYPDDDGVAQRGADFGVGDGNGLGGGFEPADPDAEAPDLPGVAARSVSNSPHRSRRACTEAASVPSRVR